MTIESGPFLTMLTLGAAGLSAFPGRPWSARSSPSWLVRFLGTSIRKCASSSRPLLRFFAFALGAGIELKAVWTAGLLGLRLGLAVVVVTGSVLVTADRLTGGHGVAGMAAASTASTAAAVPAIVAAANPAYAAAAAPASVLVAASVVVTAIGVPFVTAGMARRVEKKHGPSELSVDDNGLTTATKS